MSVERDKFNSPQIRIARVILSQDWYSGRAAFGTVGAYCGPVDRSSLLPAVGSVVMLDDPAGLIAGDNGAIQQRDPTNLFFGEFYFPASAYDGSGQQNYLTCWQPYDTPDGHWEFLRSQGVVPPAAQTAEFGNFLLAGSQTVSNSSASLVSGDSLLTVTQNTTFGDTLSSANVGIYSTSGSAFVPIPGVGDSLIIYRQGIYEITWTCSASVEYSSGPVYCESNLTLSLNGTQVGLLASAGTWLGLTGSGNTQVVQLTFCTQFEVTPQGTGNSFDAPAILTFEIASLGPIDVLTCTASEVNIERLGNWTPLYATFSAGNYIFTPAFMPAGNDPWRAAFQFSTATTTGGGIPFLTWGTPGSNGQISIGLDLGVFLNQASVYVNVDGVGAFIGSTTGLNDGLPHTVVAEYDGTNLFLQVDGQRQALTLAGSSWLGTLGIVSGRTLIGLDDGNSLNGSGPMANVVMGDGNGPISSYTLLGTAADGIGSNGGTWGGTQAYGAL